MADSNFYIHYVPYINHQQRFAVSDVRFDVINPVTERIAAAFGGVKLSESGRNGGLEGMLSFKDPQYISAVG